MVTDGEISRAISHALRHAPEEYGLAVSRDGWVSVHDLVRALANHGVGDVTEERIRRIVAEAPQQRHEIRDDQIRARYGHSVVIASELAGDEPPNLLFHGTQRRNLAAIRAEGLRPMQRQHVHLSPEKETASRVARRHGADVVVLTVKAASAFRSGVRFDHRENHVWICEAIPPEFIDL